MKWKVLFLAFVLFLFFVVVGSLRAAFVPVVQERDLLQELAQKKHKQQKQRGQQKQRKIKAFLEISQEVVL